MIINLLGMLDKWPIYYKDFLTVSNPKSNVGVCTLWTPKNKILDQLDEKLFSIGGQLYSKRGINFILRNIFANPIIDTLIICGSDRSQSGEALMHFIKAGIDKKNRVIGDKKCIIHREINKKFIQQFRKEVNIINMTGEMSSKKINQEIKKVNKKKAKCWTKPIEFKETKFNLADKFPSEKVTFNVRANYMWEAWVQIIRLIMKFGSKKGMIKIGEVKELINIVTVIEKENPYEPKIKDVFEFSRSDIKRYYKNFLDPDKGSESYNYGERIFCYPLGVPISYFNSEKNNNLEKLNKKEIKQLKIINSLDQLEEVYEKYERYHQDRGLVVAVWNPWVDNVNEGWMDNESKKLKGRSQKSAGNVPCMVLLQFTYRSKKLHLTAYFRSNDMFDAWPRNAFALRKLQFDFAKRIKKKIGYLTTISNCGQIYETNYKKAQGLIDKFKNKTFCMSDPRGTIIIEVRGKKIITRHMSEDGNKQLNEYSVDGTKSKAALDLLDKLIINNVFSSAYHIGDIGIELSKAEWCIKNDKNYIQDRDWSELY